MKRIIYGIIASLSLAPILAQAQRDTLNINRGWLFKAGSQKGAESCTLNDSEWRTLNLPHDFQIEQPWVEPSKDERPDNSDVGANIRSRLSSRGFKEMGQGWYRLHYTPSDSLKGKRIMLDFEGIMYTGDVYLNGEHIGGTDYGYVGFDIDISKKLKYGEDNVIAVMADTRQPGNSRWYTGGGLFRDVNLIVTDASLHIARHGLYITTTDNHLVNIDAEVCCNTKQNEIDLGIEIFNAEGVKVAENRQKMGRDRRTRIDHYTFPAINLERPELWSCERPYLYTARLTVYKEDGSVSDSHTQRFGVRTIEYSPAFGLRLNGQKVLLKGIANHHTLGALGAAAYPRAMEKRIQLLKEFGFNHIRTSHNPYSTSLMDLCDQYGILVVDELYDKWLKQYCGGRASWYTLWQKDIPEFIKRDRNHPSVVMWSLGNELQTYPQLPYHDWGVTPYKMQKALLECFDNTRPVTVAMHPRGRDWRTDSLPAPLAKITDIQSYNYRYMYFPGDAKNFPYMTFYQSEAAVAATGPNFFEMDLDKVVGLAYWGGIDYLGESQGWPAKGWTQGVFDIALEPKPKAYLIQSMFLENKPVVHIAVIDKKGGAMWNGVQTGNDGMSDHWNRLPGSKLNLITYTNAHEVELLVNGKSYGRQRNNISNAKARNQIRWNDVIYADGKAVAIAYNEQGKEVARHEIETSGKAVKTILTADNPTWKADGNDLQHIRIHAIDRKGRRDYTAQQHVQFTITGDAQIVAVSNGDQNSNELNAVDSRSLYNGSALVILRAGTHPGKVTLKATAPGLKTSTIQLTTH